MKPETTPTFTVDMIYFCIKALNMYMVKWENKQMFYSTFCILPLKAISEAIFEPFSTLVKAMD